MIFQLSCCRRHELIRVISRFPRYISFLTVSPSRNTAPLTKVHRGHRLDARFHRTFNEYTRKFKFTCILKEISGQIKIFVNARETRFLFLFITKTKRKRLLNGEVLNLLISGKIYYCKAMFF